MPMSVQFLASEDRINSNAIAPLKPTLSEAFKEAAMAAYDLPIHS